MSAFSDDVIEEAAKTARYRAFVYEPVYAEIVTAYRRLSDIVRGAKFEILNSDLDQRVEAFTDASQGTIFVPGEVWKHAHRGQERARFTLAHELAHLFFGDTRVRARAKPGSRMRANLGSGEHAIEVRANKFAAYFLIPTDFMDAHPHWTAAELARATGTSIDVVQNRIDDHLRKQQRAAGLLRPLSEDSLELLLRFQSETRTKLKSVDVEMRLRRLRDGKR